MTYFCVECGEECKAVRCDSGIGPYEFWGVKGNDKQPYMGSDCCEAELQDEEGNIVKVDLDDARGDEEDRAYEARREREEYDRG